MYVTFFSDLELGDQQRTSKNDLQEVNGTSSESNQSLKCLDRRSMFVMNHKRDRYLFKLIRCPLSIGCRKYVTSMRRRDAQ